MEPVTLKNFRAETGIDTSWFTFMLYFTRFMQCSIHKRTTKPDENLFIGELIHTIMKGFIFVALLFILAGCLSQSPEMKPLNPEIKQETGSIDSTDCNDSPFGFHTAKTIPTSLKGKPKPDSRDSINFYEDAQYIGVTWERPGLYCHWIVIQPEKNDIKNSIFHWELNDDTYRSIPETMCILGNIGLPERVYPNSWQLTESEEDYIHFVKAVVERYDGDGIDDMPGLQNPVLYWQVENEPDPHGDWQGYAHIQEITYKAVKEVCPTCTVLLGGMTGGGIPVFKKFYEPILNKLQGEYIDIFDFHWYGNAFGDYRGVNPVYEVVRKGLDKNGFTETEIWTTEIGTYSGSPLRWEEQTEKDQARDVVKRYVYPLSLGVEKVFWAWGLQEGFKHDNGFFDHTGFVYDGEYPDDLGRGEKKLSYYTYKKMTEILEGCDWDTMETISEDDLCIFKVLKGGKSVYVVWFDFFHLSYPFEEKEVSLPVGSDNTFRLTDAVPYVRQGTDVESYETAFTTFIVQPEEETLTFFIGKNPVYLEEIDDATFQLLLNCISVILPFLALLAFFSFNLQNSFPRKVEEKNALE